MVHERISEELPADCGAAFQLVHDYERRLRWDTLLRRAYIQGGGPACVGALAICSGRWLIGGLTLETVYVSFVPGAVAAVKMTNRPLLFDAWAASIRHEPLEGGRSRILYAYTFRARPRALAWLLEPILARVFRWETRRRLAALARHLEASG